MKRFQADEIQLSPAVLTGEFTRADLVFYGVEHRGSSFEARVFLNAPEAHLDDDLDLQRGFAGSFVVFGHGGCYGDDGHCHVPAGPRDPFDKRPPHGMTPLTKFVDVTDSLHLARRQAETLVVTVVPVVPKREAAVEDDVLFFSGLSLLAYR